MSLYQKKVGEIGSLWPPKENGEMSGYIEPVGTVILVPCAKLSDRSPAWKVFSERVLNEQTKRLPLMPTEVKVSVTDRGVPGKDKHEPEE
jgi:hypothetical protein